MCETILVLAEAEDTVHLASGGRETMHDVAVEDTLRLVLQLVGMPAPELGGQEVKCALSIRRNDCGIIF